MLKKIYFFLVFFCFSLKLTAGAVTVKTDSAINAILQIKEKKPREKQLISYFRNYFQEMPVSRLNAAKIEINEFLKKNKIESWAAYEYLVESLCQDKLGHPTSSKNAMIKAIQAANKDGDDYLECNFLNFLAYKQTEEGNVIGAVSSYRLAKKGAIKLHDTNLQMIIDINISDVYYKNDFYSQSLFYLDQAQAISIKYWPDDQRFGNIIYYNKSENFFRMGNLDSLKFYNEKLKNAKANTYKLYTFRNRTDYYLLLLRHNYKNAIDLIHKMKSDEGYKFDDHDLQNLSYAFYKNGQLDSAKFIVNQLLANPAEANHPEIKYHLYNVLGEIAGQKGDYKTASEDFKLSLQQTEDNMNRLTQVDNISSLIKVDELEGYYTERSDDLKKERIWLLIAMAFALLIILIITIVYRTIKQKRHYEKLLFAAKKEELSFINSHDVRKHLTNILGLIEVIKNSDNKGKEYIQAEDYLFQSAQELDRSIKNISEKLDD
jgi:hypothetical protein